MKTILGIAICLILGFAGGWKLHAQPAQIFQDVPPSSQYYPYIQEIAQLGITVGCSDNPPLYCPTAPITREEAAVFIARAYNLLNAQKPAQMMERK
jgi:hypothetical protein